MSDLTEFLLARIAEDEAEARSRRRLRPEFRGRRVEGSGAEPDWPRIGGEDVHLDDAMEPVPPSARALAEVEAKRRILDLHWQEGGPESWMDAESIADMDEEERAGWCPRCAPDYRIEAFPCQTLLTLATVYADHPDYEESWKPMGDNMGDSDPT